MLESLGLMELWMLEERIGVGFGVVLIRFWV